ncbi:MAG: hypothetical protein ACQESR_19365 [Planctomycetota bacterium]
MESGPTQAVLPLVGLAGEKVIRDRYIYMYCHEPVESRPFFQSRHSKRHPADQLQSSGYGRGRGGSRAARCAMPIFATIGLRARGWRKSNLSLWASQT